MLIKDTTEKYGIITKTLHWTIAILVFGQYYSIFWKRYVLPEKSELGIFYIRNLHKPLGVCLLTLGVFFLAWRVLNARPKFPPHSPKWERYAAKTVHGLLYTTIILMPLSGMVMSIAGGYPISMFGYFEIPMFLETNKALSRLCHEIHEITSFIVIGLIVIHISAALKHHFFEKDNVLVRMLPFCK